MMNFEEGAIERKQGSHVGVLNANYWFTTFEDNGSYCQSTFTRVKVESENSQEL